MERGGVGGGAFWCTWGGGKGVRVSGRERGEEGDPAAQRGRGGQPSYLSPDEPCSFPPWLRRNRVNLPAWPLIPSLLPLPFPPSHPSRLYTWGYGDGGWLGLERASKLPYVEPCPPVTKYGATCSFDSDFNACLPAVVSTLSHLRVEKVVAGGGHTIILARRIQRRFSRAERKVVQGLDGHGVGEGRAGEQDRRARGGEDVPYALMESISLADAARGTQRNTSETGEMGTLGMEESVPHTSRHANRASCCENANESTSSSSTSSSSFSSSSHAPGSIMPST